MSKYVVISSEKDMDEGGIIIHRVNVPGKDPEAIKYRAIQGGLTWPKDGAPGYYIILGQLDDGLAYHRQDVKSPLKFLGEFESEFPEKLFKRLTDDAKIFLCDEFYCDMGLEWEGFVEDFDAYTSKHKIDRVYLREAPFSQNFQFGVTKIREWRAARALDIPEGTTIRSQLKEMQPTDLKESPETNFFAVNALRFVIGGIEKYSPGPISPKVMARILRDRGARPGGFMAS